jgi:predicted MFS family arabinose efflux permease
VFVRERATVQLASQGRWLREFASGFAYLWKRPTMKRGILTGLVIAICGSGTVQLAAGIAVEIFDVDGDQLGLLVAAFGLGASTASVCLLLAGARWRRSVAAMFGGACYAAGILVVVATHSFVVGAIGFAIMGAGHVCGGTSISTSLHAQVAEQFRGRVTAFYLMAVLAGSPLGAVLWGAIGDTVGLRRALCAAAATLFGYLALVVVRFDRLRGLDDNVDPLALMREPPLPAPVSPSR